MFSGPPELFAGASFCAMRVELPRSNGVPRRIKLFGVTARALAVIKRGESKGVLYSLPDTSNAFTFGSVAARV